MTTLRVFPNPYCHLDHRGWLAGICPEGEEVRAGDVMPARRAVSASRSVVEYRKEIPNQRPSKTASKWSVAVEPLTVPFDGALGAFYTQRLRSRELFEVIGDGAVRVWDPAGGAGREMDLLDALAEARTAAIMGHLAAYGAEPPVAEWAKQFEADEEVAQAGASALEEKLEAFKKSRDERIAAQKAAAEGKAPDKAADEPQVERFPLRPAAAEKAPSGEGASAGTTQSAPASLPAPQPTQSAPEPDAVGPKAPPPGLHTFAPGESKSASPPAPTTRGTKTSKE